MVVTQAGSDGHCEYERPSIVHPVSMILYSATNSKVKWEDVLTTGNFVGHIGSGMIPI